LRDAGRFLRDFSTYLPMQAIPAIAGFFVLPILARKLFPTDLGILALCQTLISLSWSVVGGWLASAVIRELPAARSRDAIRSFTRTLRIGLAILAAVFAVFALFLAAGAAFSDAIRHNYWLVLAAAGTLIIQNVATSLLAADLRARAYALMEVAARLGGIGLGIGLVFAGHGVGGYLLGLSASSGVIGLLGLALAWPRSGSSAQPGPQGEAEVAAWLRYGVPAGVGAIAAWSIVFVDRWLLAALRDAGTVGIYSVGNTIGDKAVSIPMFAFAAAAGPLLMTAYERAGRGELERLMREYTRVLLLVGAPVVAAVAAVADPLVSVLAGRTLYGQAAEVAPIVAFGSLLFGFVAIPAAGLTSTKRTRELFYAAGIGLMANVLANLALIPPFGMMGAAIATPIGTGVYLVAVFAWARHRAAWHLPVGTLVRCALASGGSYVAARLAVGLPSSEVVAVVVGLVVAAASYVALLWLLGEHKTGGVRRRLAFEPASNGE
jgi:O-antigen/teichoic acid export membrane protein